MRKSLPLLLVLPAFLAGCHTYQQAFYTSPFNGAANDYHPLPQIIDSAHTAVYAQLTYLSNTGNNRNRDDIDAFRASFTVAHHNDFLQAYYGGDLALGGYKMAGWEDTIAGATLLYDPATLNEYAGSHSFGGVGFHGGANFVIPFTGGEWRIFGVEGTVYHEWGGYHSVRQALPDSAATLIARSPTYGTIGFTSELIGSLENGEFGFRMAIGRALGSPYWDPDLRDHNTGNYIHYRYVDLTAHLTHDRYTVFGQLAFATKSAGVSLGMAYRLNRPRNAPASKPHRREVLYRN
ncbi:MAG TPA: hypothetical protein VGM31_06570 [Puia sp.]|jgi:hypothetical protein